MSKKVLITGAAGFIGFHTATKLLEQGYEVIGIDNLNDYYDTELKKARIGNISKLNKLISKNWRFIKCDLLEKEKLDNIFKSFQPEYVINLAAQAGVRYSKENPSAYINSNIVGFMNLLECCRDLKIKHLLYASSSSVYGGNKNLPFCEKNEVSHPVSLYAATKRSNELMAHTYSHLYNLPTTGLRFFTVYGPWGRPDMGYFIFTSKIIKDETIKIFNNGQMMRDFTYVDDVVNALTNILEKTPCASDDFNFYRPNPSKSWAPYRLFNVGNSNPTKLLDFISIIENCLGKKANKEFLPMQLGDVESTSANIDELNKWAGFEPKTSLKEGLEKFIKWYIDFYKADQLIKKS